MRVSNTPLAELDNETTLERLVPCRQNFHHFHRVLFTGNEYELLASVWASIIKDNVAFHSWEIKHGYLLDNKSSGPDWDPLEEFQSSAGT